MEKKLSPKAIYKRLIGNKKHIARKILLFSKTTDQCNSNKGASENLAKTDCLVQAEVLLPWFLLPVETL